MLRIRQAEAYRPAGTGTLAEPKRLKIGAGQAASLIMQYGRRRLLEQVRAVAFISVFLVVVQSLVLGVPLRDAGRTAADGAYLSRARQASDLIIPQAMVRSVHQAVLAGTEQGAHPGEFIELSEVEKASTYRHR